MMRSFTSYRPEDRATQVDRINLHREIRDPVDIGHRIERGLARSRSRLWEGGRFFNSDILGKWKPGPVNLEADLAARPTNAPAIGRRPWRRLLKHCRPQSRA